MEADSPRLRENDIPERIDNAPFGVGYSLVRFLTMSNLTFHFKAWRLSQKTTIRALSPIEPYGVRRPVAAFEHAIGPPNNEAPLPLQRRNRLPKSGDRSPHSILNPCAKK